MMRILVCQLRTHGDIIRTFPIIEQVRQIYPSAWLAATCFEEMRTTYELCTDLDEIITQPRLKPPVDHAQLTRILDCKALESSIHKAITANYDIYIDFHGVFQSALFGLLVNIPTRVGRSHHTTKDGAHLFYNQQTSIGVGSINRMYRHWLTVKQIFPEIGDVPGRQAGRSGKSGVLVVPGSSTQGILKRWPAEKYCVLISHLSREYSDTVYVAFGPGEDELLKKMEPMLPHCAVPVFPGSFDGYLKNVFPKCRCVIGNDCAPLHLAVWQHVPVFMILGPTPAAVNAPWQFGVGAWIEGKRCQKCDPWRQQCNKQHACLQELNVDEVFNAIKGFLVRIEKNVK